MKSAVAVGVGLLLSLTTACDGRGADAGCPEIVVAADRDMSIAASCGVGIKFEGRSYVADCLLISPGRVGDTLDARSEPNDFFGAREAKRIVGLRPERAFLLDASASERDGFCAADESLIAVSFGTRLSDGTRQRLAADP